MLYKKNVILFVIVFLFFISFPDLINAKAGMIVKVLSQQEMEINLGQKDGLSVGEDLRVFRLGKAIAVGKIQKLDERTCIIRITENLSSDLPELGDSVAKDMTSLQQTGDTSSVQTYQEPSSNPAVNQPSDPQTGTTATSNPSATTANNNPPADTTMNDFNNPPVGVTGTNAGNTGFTAPPPTNPSDVYTTYSNSQDTVDIYNNPYANSANTIEVYGNPYASTTGYIPPSTAEPPPVSYNPSQSATTTNNYPVTANNGTYTDPASNQGTVTTSSADYSVSVCDDSYATMLRDRTRSVTVEGESYGGYNSMGTATAVNDILSMALAIGVGDPFYIATTGVSVATRHTMGDGYDYYGTPTSTSAPASRITAILWDDKLCYSYADYWAYHRGVDSEEKTQFLNEFMTEHSVVSTLTFQLIIENKTAAPVGLAPFKWKACVVDGEGNRYSLLRYDNVFEGNIGAGDSVDGFIYFPKVNSGKIELHIEQIFGDNYEMEWELLK